MKHIWQLIKKEILLGIHPILYFYPFALAIMTSFLPRPFAYAFALIGFVHAVLIRAISENDEGLMAILPVRKEAFPLSKCLDLWLYEIYAGFIFLPFSFLISAIFPQLDSLPYAINASIPSFATYFLICLIANPIILLTFFHNPKKYVLSYVMTVLSSFLLPTVFGIAFAFLPGFASVMTHPVDSQNALFQSLYLLGTFFLFLFSFFPVYHLSRRIYFRHAL